jgi:hypothetical membrane protein
MTVPWWGRVSSLLAPVALIGGWTVAAALQPGGFDSIEGTISALAARAATDRWVMTLGIAVTGLCHLTTALALRPAARVGRALLGIGGVATVLVAVFPLPDARTDSTAHGLAALAAFVLLAVWPFAAGRGGDGVAWGLRRRVSISAGAVLVALLVAFGVARGLDSGIGLPERLAAGAQALWPAIAVLTVPRLSRPG